MVTSQAPPMRDLAGNPGVCSGWESNQRPFGLQAGTQSTEPQQPGLEFIFVLGVRLRSRFIVLPMDVPLLQYHLLKRVYTTCVELILYLRETSVGHIGMNLFPSSLFCCIDLCVRPLANTTLSWLL